MYVSYVLIWSCHMESNLHITIVFPHTTHIICQNPVLNNKHPFWCLSGYHILILVSHDNRTAFKMLLDSSWRFRLNCTSGTTRIQNSNFLFHNRAYHPKFSEMIQCAIPQKPICSNQYVHRLFMCYINQVPREDNVWLVQKLIVSSIWNIHLQW